MQKNIEYNRLYEDGYILCFSTLANKNLMEKMDKIICLNILDKDKLFDFISKQMKTNGKKGICNYTPRNNRNHFLKSIEDNWQREYRFFWKADYRTDPAKTIKVNIPESTATIVKF